MIRLPMRRFVPLAVGLLLWVGGEGVVLPSSAGAQSLLSAGGLGIPNDASDARSRMLGGAGIGLSGSHLLPHDPAAAGRVALPGISATMEAGSERPEDGDRAGRTRFPSLGIVYPFGELAVFATFSGVLSQEWEARAQTLLDFGGEEVIAEDLFRGNGGISAARLGVARAFGDRVSAGLSAGTHVGSVERYFRRDLDASVVGDQVEPFIQEGLWRARGATVVGGVSVDVTSLLRVAGSLTWSGDLSLTPTGETEGGTVDVPLPVEIRLGTFTGLTPGLGLAASFYTADWSETARALGDEAAPGRVNQWGVGVEWAGGSILGRRVPLAVGVRQRDLPFSFLGAPASERAVTGGFGVYLADTDTTPLARLHLGLEVGSRSADEWEESFFRTTVTLRLSGS